MNTEQLISQFLKGKKSLETKQLDDLYSKPKKDEGDDATKFDYITPGYIQQADLLYLPNDKGHIYALVVTDQGSRKVDAEPLKDKTSPAIISAFKTIYNRKILQKPKMIAVDAGSEFKGNTKQALQAMGIVLDVAKAGRHRQVALVERKNQTIGKVIHKLIAQRELKSGVASSSWVSDLPILIKLINERVQERIKDLHKSAKPETNKTKTLKIEKIKPETEQTPQKKVKLLKVGQRVHVMLDEPIDIHENRLYGKFRSSDIRFSPEVYTISEVLMKPDTPIIYMLEDDPYHVGYTYNQLKVATRNVPDNVRKTAESVEDNPEQIFVVSKIIDRRKQGRSYSYRVRWKNFGPKSDSWEPRKNLVEDLGEQFMTRTDKRFDNANKVVSKKTKKK